jgi:ferric-dicitrate binding protein FerR (iron transport regulator)
MKHDERLERVALLASRLLDGLASAEERAELNELLRGDPETCELYLDLAETHALLAREHAGDALAEQTVGILPFAVPKTHPVKRLVRSPLIWRALTAAAAVALLANGYLLWQNRNSQAEIEEPSHGPGVAVLSRVVDPEWSDGKPALSVGEAVPAGTFSLRSGLAQIEFFSGAAVIIEGPAELELESAWRVVCRNGRLRAFVPEPAQGFTIVTPDYEAVDLGTEFALSVGSDGRSEVHVVDGEVRLDSSDGRELRHLGAGTAVRANDGELTPIESRGEAFIGRQKLLELARDDWRARYAAWKRSSEELRKDPAMLAYFDFEEQDPWDRALENHSVDRAPGLPAGGAIIGAQWTQGRWPGKGALEFKRITDRVRLRVPGDYQAMTLSAWVRVEGFDRWLNSLMLTDGWEPGEVHWQISNEGQLILGVSGGANCYSDPVLSPSDLGRWMHLAVTVQSGSNDGRIVHYLDGRAVGESRSAKPMPPLRIADAEIGNWRPADLGSNPTPIRSLNGRIDDFFVLARAMTPEEIHRIYEAGVPNR